ncbi:MAG: Ig-like domain-containing protein [Clostridium sp.]|jgi:hypothetical protein|nr:Ig-like domain-containing protein [Clostridium sp.]
MPYAYWLRSPYVNQGYQDYAQAFYLSYYITYYRVDIALALRPALWLDLSSVLFTTAATDGKAGDPGSSLPEYTPPEGAYKFTAADASVAPDFAVRAVSREEDLLTVAYTGAAYQADETRFLSALVREGDGVITHYGRLKAIGSKEDERGSVEVTLPEGFDPVRDTLYLFVEQSNGDNRTDFAGTPQKAFPDTDPPSVGSVTPTGPGAPVSGSLVLTFSEPMDTAHGTASLSGGSGAAEKSGIWSKGDTVCTLPYSDLAYATEYTVTVSGFRDRAGNVMAEDSRHTFTTMAALLEEEPPGEEEPPAEEAPPGGSNSENNGNGGNSGSGGGSPAAPGTVYPVPAQFGAWSGGPVTARIDEDHTKVTRLICDGAEVDPAHYTITQGSTVVTLRESYLATLAAGTYTFVAEYSDHTRSGDIALVIGSSPKTGEDGGPFPPAAIALAFLASLAFLGGLAGRRLPETCSEGRIRRRSVS